jgi:ABC-type glycerol-3-phosphate transport system substrate-binding protein
VDVDALLAAGCEMYPVFQNDINGNQTKSDKVLITSSDTVYKNSTLNYNIQVGEKSVYTAVDSTGYVIDPLEFYFKAGTNTIQLEAQRESMIIESIQLVPVTKIQSYEEYLQSHSSTSAYTGSSLKIQAEYPSATSENTIYATNDRTSYITEPQDASQQLLNAIGGDGGEKWENINQWVRWTITAPETGWYQITLRFKQSVLEGTFSSRTLRVATASDIANGTPASIPFYEAQYLQFNYSDDWQVAALNDGTTTFQIYLEEGENYIELVSSLGNMAEILNRVNASLTTINAIYIKLLMITGASPDSNRDYGFYRIMPDDVDELLRQAYELYDIADSFKAITNSSGSHAATLEKVGLLLERMGADEDKIASNMDNLKENLGTLGSWIQTSNEQPLEIDYIVIEAPSVDASKAHKANDNFLQTLWFEILQFVRSFYSDYNTLGSLEVVDEENTIEVWTTLGRDQAMIIRNLINTDFNKNYPGVSVELKLVASGSLLPSVLAGVGPDVSMGHSSSDVINWAIRSAVVPLNTYDTTTGVNTEMTGLSEVVGTYSVTDGYSGLSFNSDGSFSGAYFTQSAIIPLEIFGEYEDGTSYVTLYGLPETQSFSMMFYRADIFQNLGIDPPTTWDELVAILPILQNNNMEIAMPNSLSGLNLFNYQMGGDLYADNGKRIGVDTDTALTAFDYMCSFFSKYKCPYTYDFANRFRTGEIPIGIVDYTMYTQLSVYATEIKGLWEFVALPGWVSTDADGNTTINNTSVSGVSAMIMLYDDTRSEEMTNNAWLFMKWYVGSDNQSSYANELTALLGTVSKHNTANVEALASLSWTTSEYNNLMSQFTNLSAVREYPGGYIITRYVSFAFLSVYNDNADPEESILDYVVEINKEITRKRKEFNMTYYEISNTTSFTEEAGS